MSARLLREILITEGVARRNCHARHLIISGRVWLDDVKVVRASATIGPGKHSIRVDTFSGTVKILVTGADDFRV